MNEIHSGTVDDLLVYVRQSHAERDLASLGVSSQTEETMTNLSHAERLTTVDETGRGTPVSIWDEWSRTFPAANLAGLRDVVVVAPHPDDEVLGVGALMARLTTQGARVRVVAVTDPPLRLGLPDGAVAAHEDAAVERLRPLLGPGVTCLATWSGDGHPDHEAVGRAASAACLQTGATLLTYPVWMWHWASPADPAVPWGDAAALHLTGAEQELKRAAVECFGTQIRPLSTHPADAAILPPFVIDRLLTRREIVFR